MAQILKCKFIFDEHITKVIVDNQSLSTTTSGTTLQFSKGGSDTYVTNACTVELEEGYVLNTVVGDGEKLTDTTFNANFYNDDSSYDGYVKDYGTVTLTSKKQSLTTLDLTTLNLSVGTHTIKVKAKATGYLDSEFSNEVSYTISSGWNVTITTSTVILNACQSVGDEGYTLIKIGSTPTNANDYDYKATSSSSSVTFNNVEKLYIWCSGVYSSYNMYTTVNGNELSKYGTWDNPNEVILTQDSNIVAKYGYANSTQHCCFLPNTLINTSNGKVKIEDIKVGDFVGCYDSGYKDFIYGSVTKVIKNTNITELATLELENGTKVQFNSYHPILTQNGWKSLTNFNDYPTLTENDVIVLGAKIKSIKIETLDTPLVGYNLVVEPYNNFVVESRIVAEGSNNK